MSTTVSIGEALGRLLDLIPGVEPYHWIKGEPCYCEGWEGYHTGWVHSPLCIQRKDDWRAVTEFVAALATPSSTPDVEGLIAAFRDFTALLPADLWDMLRPETHVVLDALLRDSRS